MILIRLMGGLGNQMFQYSFGRALSIKHKVELVLDTTLLFENPNTTFTKRNFELDVFGKLPFRFASYDEVFAFNGDANAGFIKKVIRRIKNFIQPKILIVQKSNHINEAYFELKGDTCFVGRWQSYKFFESQKEVIIKDFKINKPSVSNIDSVILQIQNSQSICLHVRRGDLISVPIYNKEIGELSLSYYEDAIEIITQKIKNPHFFVFSDDMAWCKQNIKTNHPTIFVGEEFSGNKAMGHFYLMLQCKHFILANSTFAWWTAFLSENKNKIVLYPSNWNRDIDLENPDMCPKDWQPIIN